MSPTNVILSSDVLAALGWLTIAGLLEPIIAYRLNHWLDGNQVFHWAWDHLGGPALRTVIVAGFVLIAYPALFGAQVAPSLGELLADGSMRLGSLFNVLFISSLMLPALPPFNSRRALVIPLQGLIAVAMVFGWYTDYLGAGSASFWPGSFAALSVVAMATLSHLMAAEIGTAIGQALDKRYHLDGLDRIVPNATELIAQASVVLYYGLVIGRQIAI